MRNRYIIMLTLMLTLSVFIGNRYIQAKAMQDFQGYVPEEGFVPDKETAAKIAETIWLPIYGNVVKKEKPYIVHLADGIWVVTGTLKASKGGVAYIEIQKSDCKILKVSHGK